MFNEQIIVILYYVLGAIEAYKDDAHLKLTEFLERYGVSESELINLKRAWTAVYLGNQAFSKSSGSAYVITNASQFATDVIVELRSIDNDLVALENYIKQYQNTVQQVHMKALAKPTAALKHTYSFHNEVLLSSSMSIHPKSEPSNNISSGDSILPLKSTMYHKHVFRNIKIKWNHGSQHAQNSLVFTPLHPALHGGNYISIVSGECEFQKDNQINGANTGTIIPSGDKYMNTPSLIGCRVLGKHHIYHNSCWETYQFLTEMLMLPLSGQAVRSDVNSFQATPTSQLVGSTKLEAESYIGSLFHILPYPLCSNKDQSGNIIFSFEDPREVGSSNTENISMIPLSNCICPSFTAYLKRYPLVLIHWVAQFMCLIERLKHPSYINGDLHIGQCDRKNPHFVGNGTSPSTHNTNTKGYFYNTDLLNNLYVKCNGSLIMGNVAYSYDRDSNSSSSGHDSYCNENVRLVETLLHSVLCNALALSRKCIIPLVSTKQMEAATTDLNSSTRKHGGGNTSSSSPRSSPRYRDTDLSGFDEVAAEEEEEDEEVTLVNIMQGSALTIDFAYPISSTAATNNIARDRLVLLTPTLVPPLYNSYNTATNYNTSSYKTITVQEQASSKNTTGGKIAECSVKDEGNGAVLNIEGISSGSVTLYIGVCPTSAPIIRRQQQLEHDKNTDNIIKLGGSGDGGLGEVNTTSIYKRILTVRIIVVPKTPIYSMEVQQLIAVLEEERDGNSNSYTSTQCCREYYNNVIGYDNIKMHKCWKYIVEGSSLS